MTVLWLTCPACVCLLFCFLSVLHSVTSDCRFKLVSWFLVANFTPGQIKTSLLADSSKVTLMFINTDWTWEIKLDGILSRLPVLRENLPRLLGFKCPTTWRTRFKTEGKTCKRARFYCKIGRAKSNLTKLHRTPKHTVANVTTDQNQPLD